jgi:hypothetical protein
MQTAFSTVFAALLIVAPSFGAIPRDQEQAIKSVQPSQTNAAPVLRNDDVLTMLEARLSTEVIVAKIQNSQCDFDTTPDALKRLTDQGVNQAVILAIVAAPKGGRLRTESLLARIQAVVPEGSLVELETAYTINSQHVRAGEAVSFRVVNPVKVAGVIVIEAGATATARVTKATRGGHFGRAGRLAFDLQDVTAVDGTRVPIQFAGRVVGDSKGAKVATITVLTGVALGPFAPLALLNGFKRGENAILPEGRRFEVYVSKTTSVKAFN